MRHPSGAAMPTTRLSVAKDKLKFVLLEGIHQTAIDALEQDGYSNIVAHPKALAGDALIEAIADAHFLGIRSRTQLTAAALERASQVTAVGAFWSGPNEIDP